MTEVPNINTLPNDVLFSIFDQFPTIELSRLRNVCGKWSLVVNDVIVKRARKVTLFDDEKGKLNKKFLHSHDDRFYNDEETILCYNTAMWDKCHYCSNGEKCPQYTYIKCPECEGRTTYGIGISTSEDAMNFVVYNCTECDKTYSICLKCSIGHKEVNLLEVIDNHNVKGICEDTDEYIVKRSERFYEEFESNGFNSSDIISGDSDYLDLLLDETRIVRIKPIHYYDPRIFEELTGPDGGCTVNVYCSCCQKTYEICDK